MTDPDAVQAFAFTVWNCAAGLTMITTHDVPDPANLYYEIRL